MEEPKAPLTPVDPFPDALSVSRIRASKSVVVLRADFSIASEHNTTPEAKKALARFALKFPAVPARIFRRIGAQWEKY